MSLNLRIFLAYFLIVGLGIYFFLNVIVSEIKPGIRQSTEDSLVDMANLLAEVVTDEFLTNQSQPLLFAQNVNRFLKRRHGAKIFSVEKHGSNLRIYITDQKGIVVYDSDGKDQGKDYSQWNDVYLTLRGRYGARSTEIEPGNAFSTVMYIAAPIFSGDKVAGVLTVAKPNWSLQPFIDKAREKIETRGIILLIVSLIAAILISFWLTQSIRRLSNYAIRIGRGERVAVPKIRESELANLASSMDTMRRQLEGKEYVERYVHALTHELKSPVSAIKGATELITSDMPEKDHRRFMENIRFEVERIDEMINRLLALAEVEKRDTLDDAKEVDLGEIVRTVIESKNIQSKDKKLELKLELVSKGQVLGDAFLLTQAVDNVLQNASEFSPEGACIECTLAQRDGFLELSVRDHGEGIPDYAHDKIFERFYSLPRPDSRKKSSGLGLCFVKQIVDLHEGKVSVANHPEGGVLAQISLKA